LKYYFLDGTTGQQAAVTNTITTWTNYANVTFNKTSQNTTANPADIKISFKGQGSWSTVGTDAKGAGLDNPTMNFESLPADVSTPTPADRAIILHEFGHALGMMHELQSPARGERIHLKELAVYNFYRTKLSNNDMLVKTQIIDQYNLSTVSNYSHLDLTSIMMQVLVSLRSYWFVSHQVVCLDTLCPGISMKRA
jgi:Astacin (Peptidase family M12A)